MTAALGSRQFPFPCVGSEDEEALFAVVLRCCACFEFVSSIAASDRCGRGEDFFSTMVQRLTYRRRHCYATKSNQTRVVKTPGGKSVFQTAKKRAKGPKCSITGKRIAGIPHLRPTEYKTSRLHRHRKTVNRAYGGNMSGSAVRERIIRAFLVEEQKIVKKVLKIQKSKEKLAAKAQA